MTIGELCKYVLDADLKRNTFLNLTPRPAAVSVNCHVLSTLYLLTSWEPISFESLRSPQCRDSQRMVHSDLKLRLSPASYIADLTRGDDAELKF